MSCPYPAAVGQTSIAECMIVGRLGRCALVQDEGLVLLASWGQFLGLLVLLGYFLLRRHT